MDYCCILCPFVDDHTFTVQLIGMHCRQYDVMNYRLSVHRTFGKSWIVNRRMHSQQLFRYGHSFKRSIFWIEMEYFLCVNIFVVVNCCVCPAWVARARNDWSTGGRQGNLYLNDCQNASTEWLWELQCLTAIFPRLNHTHTLSLLHQLTIWPNSPTD